MCNHSPKKIITSLGNSLKVELNTDYVSLFDKIIYRFINM